ncbi:MAG: electron transfer flavoprotein subunit beta [Planctomycetes bacterium SM23_32]|nr:MAG: electron transfer flavoprotein subunit beta [Planctomycetes bacterium SM23_32]
MHVIVCIKQVPETSNVRMDPQTGTIVREGVESIVNPFDLHALELALRLKEQRGGRVTAISMGPRAAETAIREALSMGCDDGLLLSDRAFAGSDTWATSRVLSAAVRKLAPFDLVLAGVRATDGETGQVGPGVASLLALPLATYVSSVLELTDGFVTVERLIEEGYESLRLPLPCLLTAGKEVGFPRLPTLRGKQRARRQEVVHRGPTDIEVDAARVGLAGSPTRVTAIERPTLTRTGRIVDAARIGAGRAAAELADFLQEHHLL